MTEPPDELAVIDLDDPGEHAWGPVGPAVDGRSFEERFAVVPLLGTVPRRVHSHRPDRLSAAVLLIAVVGLLLLSVWAAPGP